MYMYIKIYLGQEVNSVFLNTIQNKKEETLPSNLFQELTFQSKPEICI